MKAESNIKPKKVEIENIQNDRCDIVLCDNIQEITEEETIRYSFDIYRLNICYYENIESEIETHFENYLESAKKNEYKMLQESDKDMCIDRLDIKLPENLSATNLLAGMKQFIEGLSNIFNGKVAKYRQELRDIPNQEGFPYKVVWPNKEDLK